MARRSMSDLMASAPDIDAERLDATTDEDIQRYKAAEGYDAGCRPRGPVLHVPAVADLRERMGLTQGAFARLLRIPVATLRNWEQGRKAPDPAARTLLALVAADPVHARRVLDGIAMNAVNVGGVQAADFEFSINMSQSFCVIVRDPANLNLMSADNISAFA